MSATSKRKQLIVASPHHDDVFLVSGADLRLYALGSGVDGAAAGARLLHVDVDVHPRCVSWCPSAAQPFLVAAGTSSGKVVLHDCTPSSAGAYAAHGVPNGERAYREFAPHFTRACNAVAWNRELSHLIVAGLDRARSGHCVLVWDVERGASRSDDVAPAPAPSAAHPIAHSLPGTPMQHQRSALQRAGHSSEVLSRTSSQASFHGPGACRSGAPSPSPVGISAAWPARTGCAHGGASLPTCCTEPNLPLMMGAAGGRGASGACAGLGGMQLDELHDLISPPATPTAGLFHGHLGAALAGTRGGAPGAPGALGGLSYRLSEGGSVESVSQAVAEFSNGEAAVSVAWLPFYPKGLAVGTGYKWLRMYDLRTAHGAVASCVAHNKAVLGLEFCPHQPHLVATHSDDGTGVVKVWDARRLEDNAPAFALQLPLAASGRGSTGRADAVVAATWCPTRHGTLATLQERSREVKVWALSHLIARAAAAAQGGPQGGAPVDAARAAAPGGGGVSGGASVPAARGGAAGGGAAGGGSASAGVGGAAGGATGGALLAGGVSDGARGADPAAVHLPARVLATPEPIGALCWHWSLESHLLVLSNVGNVSSREASVVSVAPVHPHRPFAWAPARHALACVFGQELRTYAASAASQAPPTPAAPTAGPAAADLAAPPQAAGPGGKRRGADDADGAPAGRPASLATAAHAAHDGAPARAAHRAAPHPAPGLRTFALGGPPPAPPLPEPAAPPPATLSAWPDESERMRLRALGGYGLDVCANIRVVEAEARALRAARAAWFGTHRPAAAAALGGRCPPRPPPRAAPWPPPGWQEDAGLGELPALWRCLQRMWALDARGALDGGAGAPPGAAAHRAIGAAPPPSGGACGGAGAAGAAATATHDGSAAAVSVPGASLGILQLLSSADEPGLSDDPPIPGSASLPAAADTSQPPGARERCAPAPVPAAPTAPQSPARIAIRLTSTSPPSALDDTALAPGPAPDGAESGARRARSLMRATFDGRLGSGGARDAAAAAPLPPAGAGASAAAVASALLGTSAGWALGVQFYASETRRAVARLCGWPIASTAAQLEAAVRHAEAAGNFERAAAIALLHADLARAVLACQRGGDGARTEGEGGGAQPSGLRDRAEAGGAPPPDGTVAHQAGAGRSGAEAAGSHARGGGGDGGGGDGDGGGGGGDAPELGALVDDSWVDGGAEPGAHSLGSLTPERRSQLQLLAMVLAGHPLASAPPGCAAGAAGCAGGAAGAAPSTPSGAAPGLWQRSATPSEDSAAAPPAHRHASPRVSRSASMGTHVSVSPGQGSCAQQHGAAPPPSAPSPPRCALAPGATLAAAPTAAGGAAGGGAAAAAAAAGGGAEHARLSLWAETVRTVHGRVRSPLLRVLLALLGGSAESPEEVLRSALLQGEGVGPGGARGGGATGAAAAAADATSAPLPLTAGLAIACRLLPAPQLLRLAQDLSSGLVARGALRGVLLTGAATPRAHALLQSYVDRCADVQTAALVSALARAREAAAAGAAPPPRSDAGPSARCGAAGGGVARASGLPTAGVAAEAEAAGVCWLAEYRALLDRWQLWHARAGLECELRAAGVGVVSTKPDILICCRFCGGPVREGSGAGPGGGGGGGGGGGAVGGAGQPGGMRGGYARPAGLRTPGGQGARSASTRSNRCPHCPNQPFPRCAVCLLMMGEGLGRNPAAPSGRFDEWFAWCQSCRHGGHSRHLAEWFGLHDECPVSNCTCRCALLDSAIARPVESDEPAADEHGGDDSIRVLAAAAADGEQLATGCVGRASSFLSV